VRKLGIKFPALIDGFENSTEKAYTGWPDRIYLIDGKGRVAYKSRPGPFGFKPQELRSALEHLPETKTSSQPKYAGPLASLGATERQR
jgi:hypothetical protein